MPGPFDNAAKRLLREKPQHFVSWLVAGGVFRRILPNELKSRNIFADGLFSIVVNEQPALLHIEFQTRNHETVPKRLLEYNVLASSENEWLPVYTCVIYLRKEGRVPESPLIWMLPSGEEGHRFHYRVVEVGRIPAKQLLQKGLSGLLPLLPLTESGAEPEVMREMVTTLQEAGEIELLALAYAFGGLVSGNEAYNEWFKRSFAMLEDILEESWTYKELIQKGLEKGREEERQQRIQEQRETLLSFVQMRFPELVPVARQQVASIKDPGALHDLIIKLFAVQTVEEARQALMEAGTES
jgi:predicted transposase YdaD